MTLPQVDLACLTERGANYQVATDANMTCVILSGYRLPPGYDRPEADLLLRLSPGYPDVPPDMWWFNPAVKLADGRTIQATESTEHHMGRAWQRWSRHFANGQWKSGVDCLETFLALIRKELERCVVEPVKK
jgi:hypothetical protein